MPYFSIVIPVYNKAAFVGKTLASIRAQTFGDFEIIVVNDGSTDQSEKAIRSITDDRIRYFSTPNQGVAKARNFGLEQAHGNWICFLDADDYWQPGFLSTMQLAIAQNPEQKAFACAIAIEFGHQTFPAQYSIDANAPFTAVNFFDASRKECVLWTSAAVFDKNIFGVVGAFDPNVRKGEDTELWMRIGLHYPIVFVREVLARYTYDEKGNSRNPDYFFESYVFEKYALLEKENPKLKQYLDLNRFSAVIKSKLKGDMATAKALYRQIDLASIGWKKMLLLQCSAPILQLLVRLKNTAAMVGLGNSVFR